MPLTTLLSSIFLSALFLGMVVFIAISYINDWMKERKLDNTDGGGIPETLPPERKER